jgi:hypothetical protein
MQAFARGQCHSCSFGLRIIMVNRHLLFIDISQSPETGGLNLLPMPCFGN